MSQKDKKEEYKIIYTLSVKQKLKKDYGLEPVLETDNLKKPGFKCWLYEITPEFLDAFTSITKKGGTRNG